MALTFEDHVGGLVDEVIVETRGVQQDLVTAELDGPVPPHALVTKNISHTGCMNIISRLNLMDRHHHTPWSQKTAHISHSGRMNIVFGLNLMDRYHHTPWSQKTTHISHS